MIVSDHLKALVWKGYILRATAKSRAIIVVDDIGDAEAALRRRGEAAE